MKLSTIDRYHQQHYSINFLFSDYFLLFFCFLCHLNYYFFFLSLELWNKKACEIWM